jgi:signal transduction histidine kinase
MEHLYKRFVVWGIAFRRNIFLTARLKLTSLYVLILAIIIGGFSLFLFSSVLQNLKDASEDDFATAASRIHFIEHTQEPIRNTLLLTDGIILLGAAGLSYWLAGRTLKPVQRSLEAQRLFAAQASHELRTPLTVIQSEAEVALRSAHTSPAELREVSMGNLP